MSRLKFTKSDIKALEAGFAVAWLMMDHSKVVLAGSMPGEDMEADTKNLINSKHFIRWYKRNIKQYNKSNQ